MGFYADHIFPRIIDWAMRGRNFQRQREIALRPAHGEVLEIGFGTGLNLPHYPKRVTRLAVTDPAEHLPGRTARRLAAARMPVERMAAEAERLPFEEERFDCVVSTWTLCTIPDLKGALAEVRRVLKPGGRFIFLEHGRSEDRRVARWQDRLNPLQRRIGCGCNLNREIDRFLADSGFEIAAMERFRMSGVPRVGGEMYCGVAMPGKG